MLPATTLKRNGVGPLPPDEAMSVSYCWWSWPSGRRQTSPMRVPPSEAQFADPESLRAADVGVVVVVVEGSVVVVVDRRRPTLDAAAPEVADANAVLAIASAATTAEAASALFLGVHLRTGVLSVVDVPPLDRPRISGGSSLWIWQAFHVTDNIAGSRLPLYRYVREPRADCLVKKNLLEPALSARQGPPAPPVSSGAVLPARRERKGWAGYLRVVKHGCPNVRPRQSTHCGRTGAPGAYDDDR